GVIDGNKTNQTTAGHGISLTKCTDAVIGSVTVQNCYSSGILLTSCVRPVFAGTVAASNGTHGLHLSGTTFANGSVTARDNGQNTSGDGVYLDATATDNVLSVSATDTRAGASKTQLYGVLEAAASGCDRNLFTASLTGNATGASSLVGTASKLLNSLSALPISGYAKASLPAPGTPGNLARMTDTTRGLWMDQGSQWFNLGGEVVNVKEFGAKGDGVTDDTAAFQAALAIVNAATLPMTLLVPHGNYQITSQLTLSATGARIVGVDRPSLQIGAAMTSLLFVTGMHCLIRDVMIVPSGETANGNGQWSQSGAAADGILVQSSGFCRIEDCRFFGVNGWAINVYSTGGAINLFNSIRDISIDSCKQGINVYGADANTISRVVLSSVEYGYGVLIDSSNDQLIDSLIGGALSISGGPALRIQGTSTGAFIVNCDLGGATGATAVQNSAEFAKDASNHSPSQIQCTNTVFQQGSYGLLITDATSEVVLTSCQFSTNHSDGARIAASSGTIRFIGCEFIGNNVGAGTAYDLECGSAGTVYVSGCQFNSTGVTNAVNVTTGANGLFLEGCEFATGNKGITGVPFVTRNLAGGTSAVAQLLTVSGVPDVSQGFNGDWAASANGHLYKKAAGAWSQAL
ncbi:MAG: hypothetical protein M1582_00620, partial [Actinobacteria bacterium]|nr:hypothetical protein [Actinomycetota bacterium]